jgi:lipid-A-disaccharide synthase
MQTLANQSELSNCEIVSDDKIKSHILQKSIFAVAKSGTVSLEICNSRIPSIILYKMGFLNFFIVKNLVRTKYANIINFAANEEVIPELLQSNCNSKNIFKFVSYFLDNPKKMDEQIKKVQKILNKLKIDRSSSELASLSLNKFL